VVREGELLQAQGILSPEERGEGVTAAKMQTDVGEPLVETPDEVEDEGTIVDDLAKVTKIICHTFEASAIICDEEVTLREAPELGVEVEGARLVVAEELGFHGDPGGMCGDAPCGDGLGEIIVDGPEDPGLDDAVHARPVG